MIPFIGPVDGVMVIPPASTSGEGGSRRHRSGDSVWAQGDRVPTIRANSYAFRGVSS